MQFLAGGKIIAAECSCFEYFSYISRKKLLKECKPLEMSVC